MDIIEECKRDVKLALDQLKKYISERKDDLNATKSCDKNYPQATANILFSYKTKNFVQILTQQEHVYSVIEKDNRLNALRRLIREFRESIEELRRENATQSIHAIKDREELIEFQAKEIERYQMEQMQSIVDDFQRHERILDMRKKELVSLKQSTESEANNREIKLKTLEKNLENSLKNRNEQRRFGGVGPGASSNPANKTTAADLGNPDPMNDPNYIELVSIDEYNPYENFPTKSQATKRGGRGGGRKRGGGGANAT